MSHGNLTKDSNKNISSIAYNVLNLPSTVTFSDGSTITYSYAADGTKLRTAHTISGTTTQKDYCENVVYENGIQKMLLTEEGYVDLSATTPAYYYYLKDHQGNNRVVVSSGGTVAEVNHYYPFGGVFASTGNVQPYKYNGKELDTKKGLNWYDYGARHYDATLGRWLVVDPLTEKYYAWSPYGYCANNPILNVDPSGMDIYRFDNQTGIFTLYQKTDDDFDQIGKFKKNKDIGEFELRTNRNGKAKTLLNNIEKGILSDGMNMRTADNAIAVGGKGQASLEGVQDFIIEMSEMIDKEIAGYYLSEKGGDDVSHVYINQYSRNTANNSNASAFRPNRYTPELIGMKPHTNFHTHLSRFSDSDKLRPSEGDLSFKNRQMLNGIKRFLILIKGYEPIEY